MGFCMYAKNENHLMQCSRRHVLHSMAAGFGGLAFNSLLHAQPHAAGRQHFPARAKRVIFLFMHGGPSHVDLFDFKPALTRHE